MLSEKELWLAYKEKELGSVLPILDELGYSLDKDQVLIGGERYLMLTRARDVGGGGYKLILTGKRKSDDKKVIIKTSSTKEGKEELEREHNVRTILHALKFAYAPFLSPQELFYEYRKEFLISVTEFIEQPIPLLDHSLQDQFFLCLLALETQEGMQATTSSHFASVSRIFGIANTDTYINSFNAFSSSIQRRQPHNLRLSALLKEGEEYLKKHKECISLYSGFLTHSDFSPHNFRINGRNIYLIDHAALQFGNKHESWARLVNFMTQYNPDLEHLLIEYVRYNRPEEESLSLNLMRVYKLGFLIDYYTSSYERADENTQEIMRIRIDFWTDALEALLRGKKLSPQRVTEFLSTQEYLRSDEEKKRNKVLSER